MLQCFLSLPRACYVNVASNCLSLLADWQVGSAVSQAPPPVQVSSDPVLREGSKGDTYWVTFTQALPFDQVSDTVLREGSKGDTYWVTFTQALPFDQVSDTVLRGPVGFARNGISLKTFTCHIS